MTLTLQLQMCHPIGGGSVCTAVDGMQFEMGMTDMCCCASTSTTGFYVKSDARYVIEDTTARHAAICRLRAGGDRLPS